VLSGDDEITVPMLALGADGLISVVSNVVPRLMRDLVHRGRTGDASGARELHERALPWLRAAFVETNPIPVKAALSMMGRFENVLRSPLVTLEPKHEDAVRSALSAVGAL
jgi:4-hydroxy-tetrahydrodipicolinate synthase